LASALQNRQKRKKELAYIIQRNWVGIARRRPKFTGEKQVLRSAREKRNANARAKKLKEVFAHSKGQLHKEEAGPKIANDSVRIR